MKPNFALTLSFEGIGLLHRTPAGWHLVGEVALESADLTGDLAALAAKARSLDPLGLRSKIVLPDEQIKYLSLESAEQDVGLIDAQVREALDGATPYALSELSYDWSVRGGTVHVAAVARETLAEAEGFGVEHDFGPLCFVAMPDEAVFAGEPFFGETVHAGKVLSPDESIERENAVIRIVGAAHLPEPEAVPEPEAMAESQPAEPGGEPAAAAPDATDAASGQPAAGEGDRKRGLKAEMAQAGKTAPVAFTSTRATLEGDDEMASGPDGAIPTPELPSARFTPPATVLAGHEPDPEVDTGPDAGQAGFAGATGTTLPKAPDETLPDTAPESAPEPTAAGSFLSRRKPKGGLSIPKLNATSARKAKASDPAQTAVATGARAQIPPAPQDHLDEKQRMTVFGARRVDIAQPDRPRYLALILTAVLLLILVAIAAWAALFLDDGASGLFRRDNTRTAAAPVPAPASAPEQETAPDEPAKTEEAAADVVSTSLPRDAADTAPRDAETRPVPLADTVPEELSPDEARARYAATGIWQIAPEPSTAPGTTEMEDVYQTNLDPPVNVSDAVALPGAEALEPSPRPPTPSNPPPPGTQFELDDRGFIAATPEGTETPEGVMIYAGAPPVKPPPTPPRAAPEVQGPAAAAPQDPTLRPRVRPEDLTDSFERNQLGGRTRTELATLRPRLRPKSAQQIAEEALAAETGTDPTAEGGDPLAGATAQAVAISPEPRPRPESFAAIVRQSRQTAAAEPVSQDQRVAVNNPTSASVARAATEKNRISLRKVNLIGVYGKPESRRALVRLANGSYRKVQVGDRLDGGQVAAIGEDELRYVKSGQSVVLKMPKG